MNDSGLGKTKQKAQDVAKKIAKQVQEERNEYVKSAKGQIFGEKTQTDSNLVNEIIDGNVADVNPNEETQLKNEERKRIKELEDELEKIRQERKQKLQEWQTGQQEELTKHEEEEPQLVEPVTKKKRGFMGGRARKKKQGTREIGKSVSG